MSVSTKSSSRATEDIRDVGSSSNSKNITGSVNDSFNDTESIASASTSYTVRPTKKSKKKKTSLDNIYKESLKGNLVPLKLALKEAEGSDKKRDQLFNINATDSQGVTMLMYAAFEGKMELLRLLVEGGADLELVDKRGLTGILFF